jgi:hypothetical protein
MEPITITLDEIQQRRAELQQELDDLVAAERVLRRKARASPVSPHAAPVIQTDLLSSLSNIIRDIVKRDGPISSPDLILKVLAVRPSAQRGSVRTICSSLVSRKEFERTEDGKWKVLEK